MKSINMLKTSRVISVSLVLAIVLGACQSAAPAPTSAPQATAAPTSAPTATPVPAGPLMVLLDNDEGPITPANFNTFIGFWVAGWVYDPLFARAPDLNAVPALATAATPSADGLTWQITLREGVKWHDGAPFTSKDVLFSYRFLIDAGRAQSLAVIDSMEANGDYGVTLKLKNPSPFFLTEGLTQYYIMPEHIWKEQKPVSGELSQFQGKIGTGPYMLADVLPGEAYTFKANPDYFRGKPRVDEIIARIVKDRTQQFNQLRTDAAAAVLSAVPAALVDELEKNENVAIARGSDFFNYVFYTNASRKPFDSADVRLAIASAIDTDKLVETVLLGRGTVLPLSFYHPDLPYSVPVAHKYDPAAAKALLDKAGVTDTTGNGVRDVDGKDTEFEVLCDVNSPVEVRAVELIVGWLKDVGIGATAKCLDVDTVVSFIWPSFTAVAEPDYDMSIFGWSSGPQMQRGFLRFLVDGQFGTVGWANLTGTSDAELDKMLAEFTSATDTKRLEELNTLIQQRFSAVLPFIPLMSPSGNFAYRPAAYDGWVYMKGTGIMTAWSFLSPDASK